VTGTLSKLFDLTGQVVVITGGSRGLGFQVALALGEYGAKLALVARKQAELDEAVETLKGQGVEAVAFAADLGDPESAKAVIDKVMAHYGRIDVLVYSAGATWGSPAEDYPFEAWNKVMNVGVTGLFLMTQAAAKAAFLPQGKGNVIAIASVAGLIGHMPPRPGTVAYNAAKGAVVNMTRALAGEWGPKNIRVNAIAPGFFPSKMTQGTLDKFGDILIAETPLGKLGNDTDLMGAALLLASDAGGHITGQTIVVDGGMVAV
jgi:gluconate 5-dehydrogenase